MATNDHIPSWQRESIQTAEAMATRTSKRFATHPLKWRMEIAAT
jgi:hypothetical protein